MDMLNKNAISYMDYTKVLKATIIAYLNNVFLYNYNGNKVESSGLDFSSMVIDLTKEEDKKRKYIRGQINRKNNIMESIKCENGESALSIIKYCKDRLKNPKLTEDEKQALELELSHCQQLYCNGLQNNKISKVIAECEKNINESKNEIDMIKYNPHKYVLKHLRNSLAHGNIFFTDTIDLNDIGDLEITFIDYFPDTTDESFKGTIKFRELLTTLSDEKFIISIFQKNNEQIIDDKQKKNL